MSFPENGSYLVRRVDVLSNLGAVCWRLGRLEEAEKHFRLTAKHGQQLPEEVMNSPKGLSSQAATLNNVAMLARERHQFSSAVELLRAAIGFQQRALNRKPNDVEIQSWLYNHRWNLAETHRMAGDHAAAAKEVNVMVWAFPESLQARHEGAMILLACAEIAASPAINRSTGQPVTIVGRVSRSHPSHRTTPEIAWAYRKRARELIAETDGARIKTPDTILRLAEFLVTCQDTAFRDPARAKSLAQSVVAAIPKRAAAWSTLALAEYRLGNWQAARVAVLHSIQLASPELNARDSLVLAMIHYQQGETDDARRWREQAAIQIAATKPASKTLRQFVAEAQLLFNSPRATQAYVLRATEP